VVETMGVFELDGGGLIAAWRDYADGGQIAPQLLAVREQT